MSFDTSTMRYKAREHIAYGWMQPNALALLCGSSWSTPVNRFGPPHPSWCQPLWHSHASTV